jgi:hypothetical protein
MCRFALDADVAEVAKKIDVGGDVDTNIIANSETDGNALYYGWRFRPECVTRRIDGGRTLPDNFLDRVMLEIRLAIT